MSGVRGVQRQEDLSKQVMLFHRILNEVEDQYALEMIAGVEGRPTNGKMTHDHAYISHQRLCHCETFCRYRHTEWLGKGSGVLQTKRRALQLSLLASCRDVLDNAIDMLVSSRD